MNYSTDVLSFPFYSNLIVPGRLPLVGKARHLGDTIFSVQDIESNCANEGVSLQDHMPVLLVHSICHLLGFDHQSDADYAVMHEEEQRILRGYNTCRGEHDERNDT